MPISNMGVFVICWHLNCPPLRRQNAAILPIYTDTWSFLQSISAPAMLPMRIISKSERSNLPLPAKIPARSLSPPCSPAASPPRLQAPAFLRSPWWKRQRCSLRFKPMLTQLAQVDCRCTFFVNFFFRTCLFYNNISISIDIYPNL